MQFDTHEDRIAAIKKACEEMGTAYGELKFKEQMLTEAKQSFVPGEKQAPKLADVQTEAEVKPVVAKAKKKVVAKPKAKPVVVEDDEDTMTVNTSSVKPEDLPTVDAEPPVKLTEVAEVEDTSEGEGSTNCPVTNANDLRNLMFKRYNELGKSTDAQQALKVALQEATGCAQASDVTEDKFEAAYDAIMGVEL